MNFAHDIILNFNDELYEFFEWEQSDKITYFKKIPIFKVSSNDYSKIKKNKINFEKNFLTKIKNPAFLIAGEEEALGIKTIPKIQKSHLNFEDEKYVLKITKKLSETKIPYKILQKEKENFHTRKQKENIKKIENFLKKAYLKNEKDKLSYIYLECFNKNETNINKIYEKLTKEIYINKEIINKILTFSKLIKQK